MPKLAQLLLPFILAILSGCVALSRPDGSMVAASDSFGTIPLFSADAQPTEPPLGATVSGAALPPARRSNELNVLAISGGGADGAFGAGVLKGWSESGRRPAFDIVTGVSTGALLATFAFLGSSWDADLEQIYTHVKREQVYADLGLFGMFQDSLYDNTPLKKMIAKIVTPRLLDAVAREHLSGRRLYVATTDLDNGTLVIWDMGGIASSNTERRVDSYRDVLLASAAFPAFFKPVYVRHIDGDGKARMHVDGGVKAPVLLRSFMVQGKQRTKTVYMLINSKLSLTEASHQPVAATVLGISKRSISELMRGLMYKTIYQGYVTTRQARARFRLIHIPDRAEDIDDPLRFRPNEMRRVYDIGREMGRGSSGWLSEPPRLEALERIGDNASN